MQINRFFHSTVISILPNIKQVVDGKILYELKETEIQAMFSKIFYISKLDKGNKYHIFINNPLEETLTKLANEYPQKYGDYNNIYALQVEKLKEQIDSYENKNNFTLGDFDRYIKPINSTDVLKQDHRYKDLCKAVNSKYTDFTSGREFGSWYFVKRNACDAIRIMTYENASKMINNNEKPIPIYIIHADCDIRYATRTLPDLINKTIVYTMKDDNELATEYDSDDCKSTYEKNDPFLTNPPKLKNVFDKEKGTIEVQINGLLGEDHESKLIELYEKSGITLHIPEDNGIFIMKAEKLGVFEDDREINYIFNNEFQSNTEGDFNWENLLTKTLDDYEEMLFPTQKYIDLIYGLICDLGVSKRQEFANKSPLEYTILHYALISRIPFRTEETLLETWGLEEKDENESRKTLKLLLNKEIDTSLVKIGQLIKESLQLLDHTESTQYTIEGETNQTKKRKHSSTGSDTDNPNPPSILYNISENRQLESKNDKDNRTDINI